MVTAMIPSDSETESEDGRDTRAPKRRKLSTFDLITGGEQPRIVPSVRRGDTLQDTPISPPPLRREGTYVSRVADDPRRQSTRCIPSPFQLTTIQDLPPASNIDTVSLKDLLGDPLIKECWHFNFLFDVDYLMNAFDEDVRHLVEVKIVHGFWKKEEPYLQHMQEAAARFPNVQLVKAYMPEPFGSHHSKMMIIFRHDDTAQVIIHTANMIAQDWTNLSQAVWRSPMLPLSECQDDAEHGDESDLAIGTGPRFKRDLLRYLFAYSKARTGSLIERLRKYDFNAVRAALVASVPTKESEGSAKAARQTSWGWQGLKEVLTAIPSCGSAISRPIVVTQVSSVASLGKEWLPAFLAILNNSETKNTKSPTHRVVFPTADEVRTSLDGYRAGSSIHIKIQSPAQVRQLAALRPMLCHWAGEGTPPTISTRNPTSTPVHEAGRRRAAPHIKTYVRFSDASMKSIDWAMVTSANLSAQAWGMQPQDGKIRICSWEIGVVVWPGLFADSEKDTVSSSVMVPTFKRDDPSLEDYDSLPAVDNVVGFRMPYDLPLVPYKPGEVPWCATANHPEPDSKGVVYRV